MTRTLLHAVGVACLLLLAPLAHAAGTVTATLDRTEVALGETVTLNVEADNLPDAAAPDFDVLVPDFVIVNRNSQQSFNIINGRTTRKRIWAVALRPRRAGQLVIPAFTVAGQQTAPLTLTVTAAANGAPAVHGNVFVEFTADPAHAWVGQEVLLTVKLYYVGNLAQGRLDDPKSDAADIRKLGDDVQYQAQRDGRTWRVVERRYALFATRSGSLQLPGLSFSGQMLDQGFGTLFGGGSNVSAVSPAVTLQVAPAPAHGSGPWLPAHDLQLDLTGWPADNKATVGQPLTLTLGIKAQGLPFEALPEPSLPVLDGAAVYPDKPTGTSSNDGQWVTGSRERKFALVPNRAGTLTFPPITLDWWNTATGQVETATIPAHTLQVSASAAAAPPPSTPVTGAPAPATGATTPGTAAASGAPSAIVPAAHAGNARAWRALAAGFFALWVLTLLAWLWRSRRVRPMATGNAAMDATKPDTAACRRAFRAAGDAATLARTLLAWAQTERPGLHSLGDLSAALEDAGQRTAIDTLQRQRWAGGGPVDIAGVVEMFAKGFAWRTPAPKIDAAGLPPLYPPR